MWFLPYPVEWSGLWRSCFTDGEQAPNGRHRGRRRGQPELLVLGSIGRTAALHDALSCVTVTELLLDDVCLQAALADLESRKPRWWQLQALGAWHQEAAALEVERHRLVLKAARLGSQLGSDVDGQK